MHLEVAEVGEVLKHQGLVFVLVVRQTGKLSGYLPQLKYKPQALDTLIVTISFTGAKQKWKIVQNIVIITKETGKSSRVSSETPHPPVGH